jgi:hypothetical protein
MRIRGIRVDAVVAGGIFAAVAALWLLSLFDGTRALGETIAIGTGAIGLVFALVVLPMGLLLLGLPLQQKVIVLLQVAVGVAIMALLYRFAWLKLAILAADGMRDAYHGRYAGGFVWATALVGVLSAPLGVMAMAAEALAPRRGLSLALLYGAVAGAVAGIVWNGLTR